MSAIPPNLPSLLPPVVHGRGAKSSGSATSDAAGVPADQGLPTAAADDGADLQAALDRIQNQNLASALTSIEDLDEARTATQAASQNIRAQPGAAQSAQSGLVPQNVLSLLQD